MATYKFAGQFNLNLLAEELYGAFPEWVNVDNVALGKVVNVPFIENELSSTPSPAVPGVRITCPDITPLKDIEKIIKAHDPLGKSKNQKDKEKHDADKLSAKTKLKDLGLSDDEIDVLTKR